MLRDLLKGISNCFTSSNFTFSSKKAISPVVATALLLVVSVVSVVSFQSWYNSYQSDLFSDLNSNSNIDNFNVGVEGIYGEELFVNTGSGGLSITRIEVDGIECSLGPGEYTNLASIDISDCLSSVSSSTPSVRIFTEESVISEVVSVREFALESGLSSSLECSSVGPGSWIEVPAYPLLGITEPFCVMQFEAKQNGSNPTSTAVNTPWVNINQTDAMAACKGLGVGYDLISNAQWMAIARDAEFQPANWNGSGVYDGTMPNGHSDGDPFNALDISDVNDPYDQTLSGGDFTQRRTLNLSNGEVIWDLGGNVWEWNRDLSSDHPTWATGGVDGYWDVQTNSTFRANAGPLNETLGSDNGVGRVFSSSTETNAFLRGGVWGGGADAGPFALDLNRAPSGSFSFFGFRCSYTG